MSSGLSECFCCGMFLGIRQLNRHLLDYQELYGDPTVGDIDIDFDVDMEEPDYVSHSEPENGEGVYSPQPCTC
jgi:hypothetical protein